MKKGDIIIVLSVLLIGAAAFLAFLFTGTKGDTVIISKNNQEVYTLSLFTEKTVDLGDNTVEIKNGKVKVTKATCKNQICVNHRAVSKKDESIVCLPNKVIVEIK